MTQTKQEKLVELNHVAENYVFSNILFIVLWCLFLWWFFFVGCLVGQVRMWTRGIFWDFCYDYLIGCDDELYDLNWDLCFMSFMLLKIYENLGIENQYYFWVGY